MSGFLERLRKQSQAELEQTRLAEEKSRLELAQEKFRQAEERRQANLRVKALKKSSVPKLARELASLLRGSYYEAGDYLNKSMGEAIWNKKLGIKDLGSAIVVWIIRNDGEGHATESFFEISGIEDESVRIGETVLNSKETKKPGEIDKAFETAYNNPHSRDVWYSTDPM